MLGFTYRTLGHYEEAESAYQEARELLPNNITIDYHLGLLYTIWGKYEQAIKHYWGAIEQHKDDKDRAALYEYLGDLYRELDYPDTAKDAYDKSLYLNPKNPDVWCALGETRYNLGKLDKAIEDYKTAIEHEPKTNYSWNSLVYFYLLQGKTTEAENALVEARNFTTPTNYYVYLDLLGLLYYQLKDENKGLNYFEQALVYCKGDDLITRLNRAWLKVVTGDTEKGLRELKRISDRETLLPDKLTGLIQDIDVLLTTANQDKEAILEMRQVLERAKATAKSKIQSMNLPQKVPEIK